MEELFMMYGHRMHTLLRGIICHFGDEYFMSLTDYFSFHMVENIGTSLKMSFVNR